MVTLEIFWDPICPWCWIGKAHLDRALEGAPDHPFALSWRPFRLNPDMPPEGADRAAYLEAKFGGRAAAAKVYARVEAAAAEAGLPMDFARIRRTPDTTEAHRLMHWAGIEGRQTPVAAQLFRRYFQEGQDISDPAVLVEAAAAAGMDRALTAALLAGTEDRDAVREMDAAARGRGVSAVPTFLIGGRWVLQGAQPPEVWARLIAELAAAEAAKDV